MLAAFGARVLAWHDLAAYPFLLFVPAVLISALLLDYGSGIYAALLSTALASYLLIQPVGSFVISRGDLIAAAIFLLTGVSLAAVIEFMRKLVDRLDAAEQAKDTQLHEVNHRFKNNLQIISALLTSAGTRSRRPPNSGHPGRCSGAGSGHRPRPRALPPHAGRRQRLHARLP